MVKDRGDYSHKSAGGAVKVAIRRPIAYSLQGQTVQSGRGLRESASFNVAVTSWRLAAPAHLDCLRWLMAGERAKHRAIRLPRIRKHRMGSRKFSEAAIRKTG